MKIIFIVLLSGISILLSAQTYTFERGFGTPFEDAGMDVCLVNNNYIVAGYTKGFSSGLHYDIYIVCFNPRGKVIWSKFYDDGREEIAVNIKQHASGDLFLVSNKGNLHGNVFSDSLILLSRLTSNGNFKWTRQLTIPGGYYNHASRFVFLPDGNIAICGNQYRPGATGIQGLLIICDTSANILLTKYYPMNKSSEFNGIILTQDNKIAISAKSDSTYNNIHKNSIHLIKYDLNGDTLWTRSYPVNVPFLRVSNLLQLTDSKIVITGSETVNYNNTFYHITDSSGLNVYRHKISRVISDWPSDIVYSNNLGLIITSDNYENFGRYFTIQYTDTGSADPNSVKKYFPYTLFGWGGENLIHQVNAIEVNTDSLSTNDFFTLVGSTTFSAHGGSDVAIVHTNWSGDTKCSDYRPVISAKSNYKICPGDSMLISVDSNAYQTFHWLLGKQNEPVDMGIYNDSIWVKIPGAYYYIGMDSDSSIFTSEPVICSLYDTAAPVISSNGSLSYCLASGQSLTLSVNHVLGRRIQWYINGIPSLNDTLESINAIQSGDYFCRMTNICGNFDSHTLTVNSSNFRHTIITLSQSLPYYSWCTTSSTPYIQASTSTVGNYIYHWFVNGVPISQPNSARTIINQFGNYLCVIGDSCGSDSAVINIPNIPLPGIIGNTTVCTPGDSTRLSAGLGLNNIQWYRNGVAIPGATSNEIYVNQSGTYHFTFFLNGCQLFINSRSEDVVVNPSPVPTVANLSAANTNICFNQQTTLTFQPSGYTYIIRRNGLYFNSTSLTSMATIHGGDYDFFITNHCDTVFSNTISLVELPPMQPHLELGSDTTVCNTQQIRLDAGPGFSSYHWNTGSSNQWIIASTISVGIDSNYYLVTVTDSNNCMVTDSRKIIFDICAGILENNGHITEIFPNMVSESFILKLPENSKRLKNEKIFLYDMRGKVVYSTLFENQTIFVGALSNGMYICKIINEDGIIYQSKLIICN